jgi:hypothetical protein
VTCDSAKQCWLVGYAYVSGSTSQRAVALRDKGAVVASATVAQPGSGYNELDAVGCVRHGPCLAVGDSDTLSGIASAFGDRTS